MSIDEDLDQPSGDDAQSDELIVGIELDEHGARLQVRGDLDDAAAPVLRRRLLELLALPLEAVTVDLTGVPTVTPASLEVLSEALTAARDRRIPMVLRGTNAAR